MMQRGIRGAVTVDENTVDAVTESVKELLGELIKINDIAAENISHVIFTMTKDIDCVYPAKIARDILPDWQYVPLMCISELGIRNSLEKCLRVLIVVNTDKPQSEIKHVYLKGAQNLRRDLKK